MARKITTGEVGGAAGGINITNTTLNAANNLDITIDPQGSGILDIRGVAALDDQFELRFKEDSTNGTNYVGFKAPAAVGATNPIWTLPATDTGTAGYALTSNGSGVLDWSAVGPEHDDETATASTYYPVISTQTAAGFLTTSRVSSTKLTYQPSTGTLSSTTVSGTNVNGTTIKASSRIGVGLGASAPAYPLDVKGIIRTSTDGSNHGIRFNDGTVQTTEGVVRVITKQFTGTATYTPTANMRYCTVYCTGAGGGGGGADGADNGSGSGGGGGGAGGTAIRTYSSTEIGANAAIGIGSAGGGGSATNGASGAAGGASTFNPAGTGTTITGSGGAAGGGGGQPTVGNIGTGGNGATSSNGEINLTGGSGSYGAGNDTAEIAFGGCGGGSFWGGGGEAGAAQAGGRTAGVTALPFGSGGGGAACIDTNVGTTGGGGRAGFVVVIEYIGS